MSTSGAYNFADQFSCTDLLFESFERIGKMPAELSSQMIISARRSLSLILQALANRGPSLWAIDLITFNLLQGVPTISLPANTSSVLDVYVRQFLSYNQVNIPIGFSTVANSTQVTIAQTDHGLTPGLAASLITPVSIGGLILQGYYEVASVPSANAFTITAATPAPAAAGPGGNVASYTATHASPTITVALANHGQTVGSLYPVPLPTTVGGITLSGSYAVASVIDANSFTITAASSATSAQTVALNGGLVQINEQAPGSTPTDRVLSPMSRTDYSSLPNKYTQGTPFSYWFDRTMSPTMSLWNVPDQNGPYILSIYRLRQLQDANIGMGETPDVQYRGLEMLASSLAVKLAVKFAPDRYELLKAEAAEEFAAWEEEDREKVPLFIEPGIDRYFRG